MNELNHCTCHSYPYYTIQIDRLLVPVIKELNEKGYYTSQSCAGHPGYLCLVDSQFVYVAFRENYHFAISFPDGSKYRKDSNALCFDVPEEGENWNLETLREYQKASIEKLLRWAKKLPVNIKKDK